MKININRLENDFLSKYGAAIKLDKIIDTIKQTNVPIEYLYSKLAEIKANLQRTHHEINFILIDKSYVPKDFNGTQIFDEVNSYLDGDDILCFELFDDAYSIDYIYQKYYINIPIYGYYADELTKEAIEEERKNRFYPFLNTVRDSLKDCDILLLKSDVDCLFEDLSINYSDIMYIKDSYRFNGDRKQDFEEFQLWDAFQNVDTSTDYIFDLWVNDKDKKTFFDRLEIKISSSKTQNKHQTIDINKEPSLKSETSYLNIIQALKDELLECSTLKNQDDLIKYLTDKYTGYSGLSEANLRDKFAKANKIK